MAAVERKTFAFLYKTEQGVIDARTWSRAAIPPAALFFATTVLWLVLRPFASRGLDQRALFDPLSLAVSVYVLLYSLCAILIGICWVNLTAKRFRDLGRAPPVGLAGLVPLLALFDGALRWLQPRAADVLPGWMVFCGDAVVAAALVWTVIECAGLRRS